MRLTKRQLKLIQILLNTQGLNAGIEDGILGEKTISALNNVEGLNLEWSRTRRLIAYLQMQSNNNGIDAGIIDGYWGPQTETAVEILSEFINTGVMPIKWRDIIPLNINPNNWPKSDETSLVSFYGNRGENQVRVQLPYPHRLAWDKRIIINSFYCHEKVQESIFGILTKVLNHYGQDEIRNLGLDLWGGCLNERKMRGGSKWSTHSWGIALDYNPDFNRLKWGREKAVFAKTEYDKWWQFWENEGWISLGRTKNYDWMHIQAIKF